jgi:hypothetical protein
MREWLWRWSVCALLVASMACSSSRNKQGAATASEIAVIVDGASAGVVKVPESGRRALIDLLPPDSPAPQTWRVVLLQSGRRQVAVRNLAIQYPKHRLLVYRDAEGEPIVGLFRPPNAAAPPHVQQQLEHPRLALDGVQSITIRTGER